MERGLSLIFISLVIVVFISGCTQIPGGDLPFKNKLPNLPGINPKEKVVTESKGLTIRFLESQPPLDEIIADQNFKVSLELSNNDPEPVSGTIRLFDTPSDEYSSLQGKEEQSFYLGSAEILETKVLPSTERITFGPYVYEESKAFKGMTTNFITEIITNHNTIVNSQLCIKSSTSQEVRCPNKETISSFAQRTNLGPIKVSKIEKTIIPDEGFVTLNLKIFLKNSGKGKIDNEDQTLNSFYINLQGESPLTCSKSDKISLKEGEKTITCTSEISIDDETIREDLVLEISYEYPYKLIESLGPIKVTKIEI